MKTFAFLIMAVFGITNQGFCDVCKPTVSETRRETVGDMTYVSLHVVSCDIESSVSYRYNSVGICESDPPLTSHGVGSEFLKVGHWTIPANTDIFINLEFKNVDCWFESRGIKRCYTEIDAGTK